jgi:DNA (cytosine-5)-methyltransferase 1
MTHGSLFSGVGGFDLAAEWMGWENLFHCEINEWCQKVLKYHFPNSIQYDDITRTDFTPWRGKVNVLTGGFPCQPFSVAGQRKGQEDDRYLWPEMLRAIREIRPTWVIGENVAGILSMVQPGSEVTVESQASLFKKADKETILEQEYVIETVCGDLEREGYTVQPILIPACGVGAPHKRDRVWFIADRSDARIEGLRQGRENEIHELESTSHSNGTRGFQLGERRNIRDKEQYDPGKEPEWNEQPSRFGGGGEAYVISDTDSPRFQAKGTEQQTTGITGGGLQKDATDTKGELMEGPMRTREGGTGFTDGYSKNPWLEFPTQPPVRGRHDGLPFDVDYLAIPFTKWRQESIKAYGNAIVPQVAFEIFKAIETSTFPHS